MNLNSKIYVAGHTGLVGSALMRALSKAGYTRIITRTTQEIDLRRQGLVEAFFDQERPEYVFIAAARVGGIKANSDYPADFLYDNLMIAAHTIHAAHLFGTRRCMFLGSSCVYPRNALQPIREEYLMSGPLEPTNEWYAIAKIAGLKLATAYNRQYGTEKTEYLSVMPTNLYGEGDSVHMLSSHVIPALIMKMLDAVRYHKSTVTLWGTGNPLREFLHVDDLAQALIVLMQSSSYDAWINVGSGEEYSIAGVAQLIAEIVRFQGQIIFDPSYPDGTPRKALDLSRLKKYTWQPTISLREGLTRTISWYAQQRGYQDVT